MASHRPSRRSLLVGGGAAVGLAVAWVAWPREYLPALTPAPGETVLGGWIKIGVDGRVVVAMPQAEHGQGSWTVLPQIVADALGADWRTVGVEAAPASPAFGNPLAMDELFDGAFAGVPLRRFLDGGAPTITGGSTTVRAFLDECRNAGSAARALLCRAAARRWGMDAATCVTRDGFVIAGNRRARFGELAAAAASESLPDPLPVRGDEGEALVGQSLPRLDAPAKVDGSATFAADVRLPDMVFASIRQGPWGDTRLVGVDRAAAERIAGMVSVVENPRWVAAVGTTWWAANRGLDALAPRFETRGEPITTASMEGALAQALARPGERIRATGEGARPGRTFGATYHAGLSLAAPLEPMAATAQMAAGRLEMWLPTQAPDLARAAAAAVVGLSPEQVTVHPVMIGGSFGAALDHLAAEQVVLMTAELRRPVQLMWSQAESLVHVPMRAAASARLEATLDANERIGRWHTRIAAPAAGRELATRLFSHAGPARALAVVNGGDAYAVAGAEPPYRLPAFVLDHHQADTGAPAGHVSGGAHGYTCFFTESFIDELARQAGSEPLSFRIGMLGGQPRLARCLTTAATLGGWAGGVAGSGQGIACHAFRGSHAAVLAEAHIAGGRITVERLVAAVDCGTAINPDLVRQSVERGLVFGLAAALGASTSVRGSMPSVRRLSDLHLPRLADMPDITVELIRSDEAPGGASEIAIPPVAPAIANAIFAAHGTRVRRLPLSLSA